MLWCKHNISAFKHFSNVTLAKFVSKEIAKYFQQILLQRQPKQSDLTMRKPHHLNFFQTRHQRGLIFVVEFISF